MRETPPLAHSDLLYRSHEEIRALQNQRFRLQVALCFRAHPYYQEVFDRLKLTLDDFWTLEDVQKLPVTTKQDYLSNPEAFRLTALPEFLPYECTLWNVLYTTGTTTGIPAPFFNTSYDVFAGGEPFIGEMLDPAALGIEDIQHDPSRLPEFKLHRSLALRRIRPRQFELELA